jgi:hypothetical protein
MLLRAKRGSGWGAAGEVEDREEMSRSAARLARRQSSSRSSDPAGTGRVGSFPLPASPSLALTPLRSGERSDANACLRRTVRHTERLTRRLRGGSRSQPGGATAACERFTAPAASLIHFQYSSLDSHPVVRWPEHARSAGERTATRPHRKVRYGALARAGRGPSPLTNGTAGFGGIRGRTATAPQPHHTAPHGPTTAPIGV